MNTHTHTEAAIHQHKRPDIDVVAKVHSILVEQNVSLAETFPEMKYVKQAVGKPEEVQRHLINRQLRLHLGAMDKQTNLARLALDDNCPWSIYLRNFRTHVLPALKN